MFWLGLIMGLFLGFILGVGVMVALLIKGKFQLKVD